MNQNQIKMKTLVWTKLFSKFTNSEGNPNENEDPFSETDKNFRENEENL